MTIFEYSAGAFVYRRTKGGILLLVLKKPNGEYDMPKGHIEKDENAEEAATREIFEETGLSVKFDPFFSESTKYFFYKDKHRIAKQVKFFLAETKEEKVRISDEHAGYEWVDEAKAIERLRFKDLVALVPKAIGYVRRIDMMGELNSEYSGLAKRSAGWSLSRRLVPGEGRLDAPIMLIGQAPGANEDMQLRPFIGRSGRLLDSILRRVHINRRKTYITSVVQFFPPENRLPTPAEVKACKPFLDRQIEIVNPRYVVLLGNLAAKTVLDIGEVQKNHGMIIERDGIKYMMTFHPAAALRFGENIPLMEADFKNFAGIMKELSLHP